MKRSIILLCYISIREQAMALLGCETTVRSILSWPNFIYIFNLNHKYLIHIYIYHITMGRKMDIISSIILLMATY